MGVTLVGDALFLWGFLENLVFAGRREKARWTVFMFTGRREEARWTVFSNAECRESAR